MPKKGENSKAVESRERKAATKKAANDKAQKAAEDALWEDNDKQLLRKKKQKEDEEKKRQDQIRKKAEAKALLEEEMATIQQANAGKQPLAKITRSQIVQETETRNKNIEAINAPKVVNRVVKHDPLLEQNLNHAMADVDIATSVDQAIAVLSVKDIEEDKHPEKRMKAAFKAFEAENMNRIKLDNPTLKLSQWKQLLQKEWTKSPNNPMNQK